MDLDMDTKIFENRGVDMDVDMELVENRGVDMDMDTAWNRCPPNSAGWHAHGTALRVWNEEFSSLSCKYIAAYCHKWFDGLKMKLLGWPGHMWLN